MKAAFFDDEISSMFLYFVNFFYCVIATSGFRESYCPLVKILNHLVDMINIASYTVRQYDDVARDSIVILLLY